MDTDYLGQLIAGIAYLSVGGGLLRLALRTKERPERQLGVYFMLTGMDYVLYTVPMTLGLDGILQVCSALARVSYAIAVVALLMFTREVFRSRESWARWLSWLCVAGLFGGVAGSFALGQWAGSNPDQFFYWPYFLAYLMACGWMSTEAWLAHASAKRRLALGLCAPIVVNRYWLWGAFGASQVVASGAVLIVEIEVMLHAGAVSRWADVLLSTTEIVSVAMLWLAFFPPDVYRRWIGTSEPASPASTRAEGT